MLDMCVKAWASHGETMRPAFAAKHPEDYLAIVREAVEMLGRAEPDAYDSPDPKRISQIDHGDYQGTLLFVIGATGYQPSTYYYAKASYGSCSGCDTLQSIRGYSDEPPTPEQVQEYMTLALHILQGLRRCE